MVSIGVPENFVLQGPSRRIDNIPARFIWPQLDRIVEQAVSGGGVHPGEGSVTNFPVLSRAAAESYGRETYFEYIYPKTPEGTRSAEPQTMSMKEFEESASPAGIVRMYHTEKNITHHTSMVRTETGMTVGDSIYEGEAPGYSVVAVRPLQKIPLR